MIIQSVVSVFRSRRLAGAAISAWNFLTSCSHIDFRLQQMTLEEAQILILRVLKQVMEEKLDQHNVQVAQVTKENGFEILTEEKLQTLIEAMMAQIQPAVPVAS